MSGGHWEYIQYRFTEVYEDIRNLIEKNGKKKTEEELKEESWRDDDWYEKYPEDKFHYKYPDNVVEEFKRGGEIVQLAQTYMHRIDWLLSGDDGEESFLKRLKEDLDKLDIVNDKLYLGRIVYHKDLYWGCEAMKIVGIRENEVELEGDYSGGTHGVCQRDWLPIEGLLFEKNERTVI